MAGKTRVLLIGIDSASPELIFKWLDELPNIRRLIDRGAGGYLESTIPPLSAPAWTSLVTGKNPGKTGVYDWIRLTKNGCVKINYLAAVKEPKIWDLLGQAKLKSCVVNVPLSYPPFKLNGIMVSGIPAHITGGHITYPKSLKGELDKIVNGYEVYPYVDLRIPGKESEYLNEFKRVLEKRVKATLYLLENKPWDFFMIVFFVLDSIQHYFWKHMDKTHPQHDPELSKIYGNVIKMFYIKMDKIIGKLISVAGRNTNVIVVSDHGMGPLYGQLLINNLLLKLGMICLKGEIKNHLVSKEISKSLIYESLLAIIRTMNKLSRFKGGDLLTKILPFHLKERFTLRGELKLKFEQLINIIDFKETKALAIGESGGIFIINEAARNIVKNVLEAILRRLGCEGYIYEKDEIYKGYRIDEIPDILYVMKGYKVETGLIPGLRLWQPSTLSGYHTRYGIIIMSGPKIIPLKDTIRQPLRCKIYDVMPTVLKLFGLRVPPNVDGKPLECIS